MDHSPLLGHTHTSILEELSQETLYSDDRPKIPPSTLEVDPGPRALPAEMTQTQGALLSERLSFLNLNVQKAGSKSPSLTDIVSLLNVDSGDNAF
jgi:hypothetical protein